MLTRAGNSLALPGLAAHPLLAPGSPVLVAAQELASQQQHATFLCPDDGHQAADGHLRITVLRCPSQPPHYLSAAVVVSTGTDLRRLTGRELQILGLLIEDRPICFDHEQTIMWPALYSGNQLHFRTATRDSGHNNRRRISVNMQRERSQDFAL